MNTIYEHISTDRDQNQQVNETDNLITDIFHMSQTCQCNNIDTQLYQTFALLLTADLHDTVDSVGHELTLIDKISPN